MNLNFFQRRARLKNANYLELTPICVASSETDRQNNKVIVLVPRFTNRFICKHIVPKLKTPYIKVKLDEIGSASWLLINGKLKVAMIANELAEKFGGATSDFESRLTKFLTFLYEQRLITFVEIST